MADPVTAAQAVRERATKPAVEDVFVVVVEFALVVEVVETAGAVVVVVEPAIAVVVVVVAVTVERGKAGQQ